MKKIIAILTTFFMLASISTNNLALAAVPNDNIRVGLVTNFKDKSSLSVSTTDIGIGYSTNNTYKVETSLRSNSGFKFTPARGYFYISTNTYPTYEEALAVTNKLNSSYSVTSYPALTGPKEWSVYLGNTSGKEEAKSMLDQVQGKFNLSFTSVSANNKHRVLVTGDDIGIVYDGLTSNAYPQIVSNVANKSGVKTLTMSSQQFRGRLEIGCYATTALTAVGILKMDEYLYGVLPSEMVTSWPEEALKTQAVVSRTYSLNRAGYNGDSNITKAYILNDTTSSQVYKGYDKEAASTNKAIDDTSGVLIYYNNKIIDATFFSTSGGATVDSEDVWGSKINYLRGVPDIYELEPEKAPWLFTFTAANIKSKLSAKGINIGNITKVEPDIVTDSGYLYSLKVTGTTDFVSIQRDSIRNYFGLYSTRFKVITNQDVPDKVAVISGNGEVSNKSISKSSIISGSGKVETASQTLEQYIVIGANNLSNYARTAPKDKDTYVFAGMGYGHGVGMSQSGAKGMAKAGYTYDKIIKHYYTGVTVK